MKELLILGILCLISVKSDIIMDQFPFRCDQPLQNSTIQCRKLMQASSSSQNYKIIIGGIALLPLSIIILYLNSSRIQDEPNPIDRIYHKKFIGKYEDTNEAKNQLFQTSEYKQYAQGKLIMSEDAYNQVHSDIQAEFLQKESELFD